MSNTPAHTTKQQTKKKFIVSREFSGNQLTVERLAGTWYYNGVVSLLIE